MSCSSLTPRAGLGLAVVAAIATGATYAAENPATELEAPSVEVIGTTPLPEIGIPVGQVPANVQAATAKDISKQISPSLSDYLTQNLGSMSVTDSSVNPFQPDVNFRGFTASPLLGIPQGLSVFQDGVRINEAFGDTVNWDFIPQSAISSVTLIPGSNPVFGLNTLGGALSIQTKSGFDYPGTSLQTYGGSFGRRAFEIESGGHGDKVDYFVTGNAFQEDGWRDHSPSRVNQVFAKTGYQDSATDVDLSFTGANNALQGTQALPLSMLDSPQQAYTWPDINDNRLAFLNLKASHFLSESALLAGDLYYRKVDLFSFNSNVNDNFDPLNPTGPGTTPAQNILADTHQVGKGGTVQMTLLGDLAGHKNNFVAGLSLDHGETDFTQFTQDASFSPDRGTLSSAPINLTTQVIGTNNYYGAYLTDTFAMRDNLHLTASGRYNYASVKLADQLGTALSGDHSFSRFNPAAGVTYEPMRAINTYVTYNQGMRVPTPVELTCADPNAPCSLPNAFVADPSLKPVISKTWEAGLRGRPAETINWSAAVFRTDLHDDIQFVSSGGGAISSGFFQNVGETQRQGIELGLNAALGKLLLTSHYSFIDATFQSPLVINSPNNSTAQPITCATCTDIRVNPGDRIPGIPRHQFNLRAEYGFTEKFSAAASLIAASDQFARGDENNQDVHGTVPGYALVNLDARYQMDARWQFFGRIENLFNRRYQTLGLLGENVFTGPGGTFNNSGGGVAEQFRSPGAPFGIWAGVVYAFDAPKALKRTD
ncbi:MAG TPA: TonB-dependent receptor [Burkholderiales bacterium]|nr:TonB-dependent receptor [Burkholderiales bacterium]